MKRILCCLAALVALCALTAAHAEPKAEKALTLMIYMCGSNLESQYACGFADIEEIQNSGVDAGAVDVLLLTGGSRYWYTGQDADTVEIRSLRYSQRAQRNIWANEKSLPAASLGQADTLLDFLNYTVANHPAKSYALVLWDHGGGPMEGLCWDEIFDPDHLGVRELADALDRSPFGPDNPLEWIGFDACLMGSVETACACAPYAKYMIASQETEPGTGWNYDFLSRASEGLDGETMGRLIVDRYSAVPNADQLMLTLSCVDLGKVDALEAAIDALFTDLDTLLEPERFSEISNGRRDAKGFGRASTGSEYDLVDLYSLSEQYAALAPEKSAALQGALEDAVLATSGNQSGSHGLSIYYPYYNKSYFVSPWHATYSAWGFVPGYRKFLDRYADVWLGEQMADWSGMKAEAQAPGTQGQEITLPLTEEQAASFGYARLNVVGPMAFTANGYYYKVYETGDVTLDDAGVLHADYDYKALYVVDGDGVPLCDAIPYRVVDGYYLIRANLSDKTWNEYWHETLDTRSLIFNDDATLEAHKVYLQCQPNAAGDGLDVVGVIDMQDNLGVNEQGIFHEGEGLYTGKQAIDPNLGQWPWVWFFHFPRALETDADGAPLPFDDWPSPNRNGSLSLAYSIIDNTAPWSLKFLSHQYSGQDLYAQFTVWDTQGNPTGSNLIPVANPNLVQTAKLDEVIYDSDDFTLRAVAVDLAEARFNDGLVLRFTLEDHRPQPDDLTFFIDTVTLNDCAILKGTFVGGYPDAEGRTVWSLYLPTDDLPETLETDIHRVNLDIKLSSIEPHETVARFTAVLDREIDLSPIHTPSESQPLAEARASGFIYQLMDIADEGDYLTLSLRAENTGDQDVEEAWQHTVSVNGCEWPQALSIAWFEVPAGCWTMCEVKLYKTSPSEEDSDNRTGLPSYSYPEYWGITAVESLEFTDWNNSVLRFRLAEPFPLVSEGGEGAANNASGAPVLLDGEDLFVRVTSLAGETDGLHLALDIENRAEVPIELTARDAALNDSNVKCKLTSLDDHYRFGGTESIEPGQEVRLLCLLTPDDLEIAMETLALGFEYLPEGATTWRRTSPARLALDGAPSLRQLITAPIRPESLALLQPCTTLDHSPRDPASLVAVGWADEADGQTVTLRAPLTDEQAAAIDGLDVMLVLPCEGDLQYLGSVHTPARMDGNILRCDFPGALLVPEGVETPLFQHVYADGDGWLFDIRAASIFTDNASWTDDETSFETLRIDADPISREARLREVSLSRDISASENLDVLEYWNGLYAYQDGEGSPVEQLPNLVGEDCELGGGPVRLALRPATDLELQVVFCIENADGSAYTISLPYAEAVG